MYRRWNLVGAPQAREDFEQDRDFYASDGFTTVSSGTAGAIDNIGSALLSVNQNKYVVEHTRSFVLGPMPRRVSSTSAVVRPYIPAVQATPEARDYYECAFDIKYGGVKIMAPTHKDNTANKEEPITIMDVKYKDLRSDILRWCIISADIKHYGDTCQRSQRSSCIHHAFYNLGTSSGINSIY